MFKQPCTIGPFVGRDASGALARAGSRTGRWLMACMVCLAVSACGDRAVGLYSGLTQAEANRLVAFLDAQGITTHKLAERDGTTVTVSASQLATASRLATQAGLPRESYKGFGAVFPKDGLISSPLEERARLTYAVSQELEAMLVDIDGVLGARVNVVIPERRNGRYVDLPSAAVLVRHRADLETDLLEMKVRRLVASSVPGLVQSDDRQISVSFMPVGSSRAEHAARGIPVSLSTAETASTASVSSSSVAAGPDADATVGKRAASTIPVTLAIVLAVVVAAAALGWYLRVHIVPVFSQRRRRAPAAAAAAATGRSAS